MVAGWIGLISNLLLTAMKLVVGTWFRSPSLVADGIHNGVDVLASAVSLSSMKVSKRPADEEHPYGHGKIEVIASGVVAIILALASIMMIKESIEALFDPEVLPHGLTLLVAVLSLVWKQILYLYTMDIGKKANSKGLIATAYDHLSDVYASIAVVIGIGFAYIADWFQLPGGYLGDPIAGIIVSFIILHLAYRMGFDAFQILIERNVSDEQLQQYQKVILQVPQVKRIDRIRAREHGHYILIDLRVSVPGELTVQEGHDIAREIKKRLMDQFQSIEEVLVHVNPWYQSFDFDRNQEN